MRGILRERAEIIELHELEGIAAQFGLRRHQLSAAQSAPGAPPPSPARRTPVTSSPTPKGGAPINAPPFLASVREQPTPHP